MCCIHTISAVLCCVVLFLSIPPSVVLLNISLQLSADNVGMCPIHWACTEASIPHVALLWKHGANLEARDSSGCTPLLVAAQYGQVDVVAYLLKNGANIQAVDTSRDTALHWAAYKGSIQVCGLLAFYQSLSFTTQDAYGQTPLVSYYNVRRRKGYLFLSFYAFLFLIFLSDVFSSTSRH